MQIDSDICFINYPQETENWYKNHGKTYVKPVKKSNNEIIEEIYAGLWGNGKQRYDALAAAGYDYYAIQDEMNRRIAEDEKKKPAGAIKVGSTVKVKPGAKYYDTGRPIPSYVCKRPHIVCLKSLEIEQ